MLGRSWVEMSATAPIPRATAPRRAPPVAGAREDRRGRRRPCVGNTVAPRPLRPLLCLARLVSRTRHAQAKRFHRAGAERAGFLYSRAGVWLQARGKARRAAVDVAGSRRA